MTLSTPMFEVSQCVSQYNKVCDTRARSILSFACVMFYAEYLGIRTVISTVCNSNSATLHTASVSESDPHDILLYLPHTISPSSEGYIIHMHVTCKRSDLHWLGSRRLHGRLSCVKQKTRVETRTQPPTALTCKYGTRGVTLRRFLRA